MTGDLRDGAAQLVAAIAAQAAQEIAGEAFGMQARQHRAVAWRLADDDGEMFGSAVARPKGDHAGVLRSGQGNPRLAHDAQAAGSYQLVTINGADGDIEKIARARPLGG